MRAVFFLCLLAFGVAVCGCSGSVTRSAAPDLPQAMPVDPPDGSLMLTANTYAGDALYKMLLLRMGSGSGILATSLVNLHDFNATSGFGRVAAQQVASRISQYGFRVIEARLAATMTMNARGEFILTREAARLLENTYDAGAVLAGCYSARGDNVYLSLRVVRLSDNTIMAAYEYWLPREGDVERLLADSGFASPGGEVWRNLGARTRAFAPGASEPAGAPPVKSVSLSVPAVAVPRHVDPAKPAPEPAPVKRAAATPKPVPAATPPQAAVAPAPAVPEKDAPAPAGVPGGRLP